MMQRRRDFLKMALGVSAAPALGTPRRGQDARDTQGRDALATQAGGRLPIRSTGSKIKSVETFTSGR
jgi:hypothetical protein